MNPKRYLVIAFCLLVLAALLIYLALTDTASATAYRQQTVPVLTPAMLPLTTPDWEPTATPWSPPVDALVPAWHYEASAQANCAADNTSANVGWLFRNTDTRTMRVTVRFQDQSQVRDILAGSLDSGTFAAPLPLTAGVVRFAMAWIGVAGTDSTTRSYAAIASCAPTAVTLKTFGASSGAPLPGNQGGCGHNNENMRYGIACNVTDAGVGFVSGTCKSGYWFSRVATRRTFRLDQAVTVNGCEGLKHELYAPIHVSR